MLRSRTNHTERNRSSRSEQIHHHPPNLCMVLKSLIRRPCQYSRNDKKRHCKSCQPAIHRSSILWHSSCSQNVMRKQKPAVMTAVASIMLTAGISIGANTAPAAHVAAPAAIHSSPAAEPVAVHSSPSPSPVQNRSVAANPTAHEAVQQSNANQRSTNGQHRHDFDRHYSTVYGDPWWGYSGNWNSGWYGNGYTNTGYYNDVQYTPSSSTDNSTPPPETSTPSQNTQTPAGNEAELENAVNRSPQMAAADAAVQSAQSAYDSERERVLASLTQKPEYEQAIARRHQAASDLRAVQASPASRPSVVSAASAKLDAADDVTKMQEQAIANDPAAAAAKTHLNEAVAARDGLRAQMLAHH
jgi:hypothetical protein